TFTRIWLRLGSTSGFICPQRAVFLLYSHTSSLAAFRCCCTFLIPKTESSAIFYSYRSPPNRVLTLSGESLVLQRCKFLTRGSRAPLPPAGQLCSWPLCHQHS
uniref:Uncharacterized protein n=1 Tax=Zosterops lateralis melanops TaxID=1220523 RepID=A0A8D2QPW0_ZOSLA